MSMTLSMQSDKQVLGIVGGMGPLASAEFLKTIYEYYPYVEEQEAPAVILYSDPSIPDRTTALHAGQAELLARCLESALVHLQLAGAHQFVLACVTMHQVLPRLPLELRQRMWSLLDIIYEQLLESNEPHLLLCTSGSRELEIFQAHSAWKQARHMLIFPDMEDQELIHQQLYALKRDNATSQVLAFLHTLQQKYHLNAFVAGCTEVHLLTKYMNSPCYKGMRLDVLDPLLWIAQSLARSGCICSHAQTTVLKN